MQYFWRDFIRAWARANQKSHHQQQVPRARNRARVIHIVVVAGLVRHEQKDFSFSLVQFRPLSFPPSSTMPPAPGEKLDNSASTDSSLDKSVSSDKTRDALLEDSEDVSSDRIVLKKNVSMLNGIGLIVGTVIGSGIFISPTGILTEVNSVGLSLIVWLGCGLLAMFGCLCYTELGTFITKSGGEYAYLKEAFGRIPAFLFAWTSMIIIRPASGAIIALIFAEYVAKPFYPDCEAPVAVLKLLACLCLGKIHWCVALFFLFLITKNYWTHLRCQYVFVRAWYCAAV